MTPEQARQFAGEWAFVVGGDAKSPAEIADVLHSCILSGMLMMSDKFGQPPEKTSGMIEIAVQKAIEDFSNANNKGMFGRGGPYD